ncbi:Ribosome-binding protein 1 [Babesia ovata]|uniref:Ribosome-binding protein 1 n=1 Tax=Babesia ovata TaxID=189622 RepID=A0A2H6KDE6_9APIC|nr:Ribosome-binding protein 1 [Babesia ovata]GBE61015.1 Ribosome-binding protein 1 [Babesia ovata]
MTGHGVPLDTLKQCLQFLMWLKNNGVKQGEVAEYLHGRIKNHFNSPFLSVENVEKGLSPFLTAVSNFYERLCYKAEAGSYGGRDAEDIANALLDCLPKFLAAIYYLEYCVTPSYDSLGGGGWKDWLGYNAGDWWGGDLANYLHAPSKETKYGVIPGGFTYGDVRYYSQWRAYYQGSYMVYDLQDILKKQPYNFFRSVFNLLRHCAREEGQEGGELINALNDGLRQQVSSTENSICWKDLKDHCAQLRKKFDKLNRKDERFDFTGQSTRLIDLNTKELAKETAKWMRTYLNRLRGNLVSINTDDSLMKLRPNQLGEYFTKYLFPYGFTFNGEARFRIHGSKLNGLKEDWRDVIGALHKSGDGDLDRLKEILEGKNKINCAGPASPPKKPEVPPAKVPEAPKEVVPEKKVPVVPPKKPEVPPAKVPEGNQNEGKKSEGAQNQGKKSEGAQNQGKGLSGDASSGSASGKPAAAPPPGAPGGAGPVGPPTLTGGAGSTSRPTVMGQSSTSDDATTIQPGATHGTVRPQTPGTSGSNTGPPGGQGDVPQGGGGAGKGGGKDVSQGTGQTPSSGATPSGTMAAGGVSSSGAGGGVGTGGTGNNSLAQITPVDKLPDSTVKYYEQQGQIKFQREKDMQKIWDEVQKKLDQIKQKEFEDELDKKHRAFQNPDPSIIQKQNVLNATGHSLPPADHVPGAGLPVPPGPRASRPVNYRDAIIPGNVDPYASSVGFFDIADQPRFEIDGEAVEDKSLQEIQDEWNDRIDAEEERDAILNKIRKETQDNLKLDAEILNAEQKQLRNAADEEVERQKFLQNVQDSKFNGHEVIETPFIGQSVPYTTDILGEGERELKARMDMAKMYAGQKQREYDRELSKYLDKVMKGRDAYQPEGITVDATPISSLIRQSSDHLDIDIYAPPRSHTIPERPDPDITQYINDHPKPQMDIEVADKWSPESNDNSSADFKPADLSFDFQQKDPYYSRGLPPIPPEILIEHKDYKTSNEADDLKLEPTEDERSFTDLQIDLPDRPLKDPVDDLDFNHNPPTPPTAEPLEPIGPSTTAVAINFPPIDPPEDLPKRFADTYSHSPDAVQTCVAPWLTQKPTHDATDIPVTELFPSEAPRTVKDMLVWMAGLQNPKHQEALGQCINNAFKRGDDVSAKLTLPVNGAEIRPEDVLHTIHLAAMFAASVLSTIEPAWKSNTTLSATLKPKDSDQSKEPDACALLCQLRDYAYACCHQLQFLKSQCSRDQSHGGWQDCEYGNNVPNSPLQAFLTDSPDSEFKTHPFDPCDICRKSRVSMGFREEHLPKTQQTGKDISTILTPTCGGDDPLLTLSSYLNCLTRRTPRTTGELVSFFHNFGNELHGVSSELSKLGSALSTAHRYCPNWDRLKDSDLQVIKDARGSAPPNSNHNHDKDHPNTLSSLLGCDITNAQCPQHMKSITYRAYALYSSSFVHHYLSWAAYLPDRLRESLVKLHCDLKDLQCHDSNSKSLHQCAEALPLLYSHGFTPPDGMLQSSLTCSKVITKLEEVLSGKPIADLMTAMDTFLYGIRAPFLFCLVTLWLTATLYIAHSLLYRIDILHIRSHLLTTRASHRIDVKALLAGSRRMLSLYKDVDYFDDIIGQLDDTIMTASKQ